jgi:hypothetical protein
MKSRQEMWIEARRLEEIGRQTLEDRRRGSASEIALTASVAPVVLYSFAESVVRINAASEYEGPLTHRMLRRVEFSESDPEGPYQLVEEEIVTSEDGQLVQHYEPATLVSSDDPFDVLSAGYQRQDEDRLCERLEPVIDRMEANTFPEPVTSEAIAEVERLVSDLALSPVAKLRMKVDAVAFLEGTLEAGDFVARTVARQDCYQPEQTITAGQRICESIEVT